MSPREPLDDRELVRYLLGQATAEEQTALEDRYLLDDDLTERMRVVEAELIAAYWRDRLSPQDRDAFERHYLAAPVRREHADFEKMLLEYAANRTADRAVTLAADVPAPRVRPISWLLAAGWAAVLVLAAGGTFEIARIRSELASVRAQLAEMRALRASAGPGRDTPLVTPKEWVRLQPGRVREGRSAHAPSIRVSPSPLALRLDVPVAGPCPYRLIVETGDSREVWRTEQAAAERALDGWAVFIVIDRALDPGDYVLTLRAQGTGGRPGEDVAEYFLRITAQ